MNLLAVCNCKRFTKLDLRIFFHFREQNSFLWRMKGVNRIKCLDYFWELLKQYVRVVLFIKLDKVVLTMKSEAVQGCSSFSACSETLVCDHSNERFEQCFHVVLFILLCKVVLTFKSVDETLVCDHSNESFWAILSCSTVRYAVWSGSSWTLVVQHSKATRYCFLLLRIIFSIFWTQITFRFSVNFRLTDTKWRVELHINPAPWSL